MSTPNYAGVSWWLRGPGLGVAPSGRASELVVTVQLRHSSGLRPLVLTLPLVSACWLPSSRLQPPDPGTVKTGVQRCSSSPHQHHAAHIVDTGIVLTSPAQPSLAQPSPDQTGRCRLELDNGGGAAAHRADTRDPINSIWSIVPDCKIFHWSGDINIWVSTLGICQE